MPPDLSAGHAGFAGRGRGTGAAEQSARPGSARRSATAATVLIKVAQSELGPRFNLEGTARYGDDIDGFEGRTSDLQARVVMRWKIFDGFANTANVREQKSRADEVHARLFEMTRRAEEDTRSGWSRLTNQSRLVTELETQSRVADDLLLSYREQFNVGRRSLLDVLDAQNTRFNVQSQPETARMSKLYAQYRILAASNRLIEALGVQIATEAGQSAREVRRQSDPAEDRQENSFPYPRMGPPAPEVRCPACGRTSCRPSRRRRRTVRVMKGTGVEYHALAGFRAIA